jgi:hypothetical protein
MLVMMALRTPAEDANGTRVASIERLIAGIEELQRARQDRGFHAVWRVSDGKSPPWTVDVRFNGTPRAYKVWKTVDGVQTWCVRNGRYGFFIRKPESGPYSLSRTWAEEEVDATSEHIINHRYWFPDGNCLIHPVLGVLKHPSCKVQSLQETGDGLIVVRFTLDDWTIKGVTVVSGRMTFKDYGITEADFVLRTRNEVLHNVVKTEYVIDKMGRRLPKRTRSMIVDSKTLSPVGQYDEIEYLSFADSNPDDAEFSLSHFGYPEPGKRVEESWSCNAWLAGIGLIALLLGLVLQSVRRRVAQRSSSPRG